MSSFLRRASVATACLALTGGALLATDAGGAEATPAPSWVATATQAVHLTGARLGATPAGQRLHITVALTPRDARGLQSATKAMYTPGSPTFHHYLSASQWRARYAPTAGAVAQVTDYLRRAGLTRVDVAANHLAITAESTAAVAERAFHTSLVSYRTQGRTVFGNQSAAQVPAALHPLVSAVLGLDDVPVPLGTHRLSRAEATAARPAHTARMSQAGSPSTTGLFPGQFRQTYDADGTTNGSKTAIAVMSEGVTAPVISSLRYAEQQEHATRVPVSVVRAGVQSDDAAGVDEFAMDTQASTIFASDVKRLYLYNIGGLTDSQITFGLDRFVADDRAEALSASLGGCEYASYLDGSELAVDTIMQEAAMQGQTFMASSGDEGDACAFVANTGTPAGVPDDEWPAVGEFDLAVGGTSLVSDAQGNRIQELAWLGGGGGDSAFELPGFWTQDSNPGFDSEFVTGGRGVPDVALDADPNVATPVKVYVGKTVTYIGGTSLSSPLMLGVWARLESAHQNRLGLAPIALYDVYNKVNPGTETSAGVKVPAAAPKPVPGYTDIVLGSNGAYQAKPGWDYTTGLGAPDVKQLARVIAPQAASTVKPGIGVRAADVAHHGGRHMLQVTVRITHPGSTPATGRLAVKVVNGRLCHATVKHNVGSCRVLTTKAKRHVLRIDYSGDRHYDAAYRTRSISTR